LQRWREMTEPLTVLLVDDDTSILTSLYRVLEEEGYSVLAAGNGVDALDICRQSRHPIDLLLTDVAMPEMSGFELAERALLLHPLMKILFMSGDTGEETRHWDEAPGVRLFLAKPFNWIALVHKLRAAVGS